MTSDFAALTEQTQAIQAIPHEHCGKARMKLE
jgi:hypothetical protein